MQALEFIIDQFPPIALFGWLSNEHMLPLQPSLLVADRRTNMEIPMHREHSTVSPPDDLIVMRLAFYFIPDTCSGICS